MTARAPWWRSNAIIVSVIMTVMVAVVSSGILLGRSLQRLDDLTYLVTDTRTQVAQGNQQLEHLAQGLAQVEGALGVRGPQHASLVVP